jgi:hypothetical protein
MNCCLAFVWEFIRLQQTADFCPSQHAVICQSFIEKPDPGCGFRFIPSELFKTPLVGGDETRSEKGNYPAGIFCGYQVQGTAQTPDPGDRSIALPRLFDRGGRESGAACTYGEQCRREILRLHAEHSLQYTSGGG